MLPPHWTELPDSIDEDQSIDPWTYHGRLSAYKLLLEGSGHCSFGSDNNAGSVLWGLALQFGWQKSSGRLNTEAGSDAISPDSW